MNYSKIFEGMDRDERINKLVLLLCEYEFSKSDLQDLIFNFESVSYLSGSESIRKEAEKILEKMI